MCVSLAFVQILPHLHTDIQQQPPAAAAAANKNGKSQSEASKSMQATDRPTNKTYQPIQMHRLDVHTWQRTQTLLQYGAWNTACLRIAHTITKLSSTGKYEANERTMRCAQQAYCIVLTRILSFKSIQINGISCCFFFLHSPANLYGTVTSYTHAHITIPLSIRMWCVCVSARSHSLAHITKLH